jgi:hypothetical protein
MRLAQLEPELIAAADAAFLDRPAALADQVMVVARHGAGVVEHLAVAPTRLAHTALVKEQGQRAVHGREAHSGPSGAHHVV